ncbi:hypothetical protein [Euhalothece natronophila]|nr:hypothetical protein [Euhalothece natronophila]
MVVKLVTVSVARSSEWRRLVSIPASLKVSRALLEPTESQTGSSGYF